MGDTDRPPSFTRLLGVITPPSFLLLTVPPRVPFVTASNSPPHDCIDTLLPLVGENVPNCNAVLFPAITSRTTAVGTRMCLFISVYQLTEVTSVLATFSHRMRKQFSINNVLRLIGGRGLIFRFSAVLLLCERKAGVCVLKATEG